MHRFLVACALAGVTTTSAWAVNGNSLAFNSGSDSGSSALLSNNGYVGTYVQLASPGDVTVTVNASGTQSGGTNPHMNIVIADTSAGFDVSSGANNYVHEFENLPAGTYFVRTEFTNDGGTGRALSVGSLNVSGATVLNNNFDSYALAASDTYIANFRKGPATLGLSGIAPGADVHVKLKRHAFSFGTNAYGNSYNDSQNLLGDNPTTTGENFQEFINSHFNALVPSNYGKWANDEGTRDSPFMGHVDTVLDYAEAHNMRSRMHALIWSNQQPGWASNMLNNPNGTDPVSGDSNSDALRDEISERIRWDSGSGVDYVYDRAERYIELDVLNEALHQPAYWNEYGASGIADIYNEAAQAAADAGADVKLYTNEYNVLQNSPQGINNGLEFGSDPYANWYRQNIDDIRDAGGEVSGVGAQYYARDQGGAPSTDTIMKVLQNLAVTGLPFTLTEFGAQDQVTDEALAADIVEEALRMIFGNPNSESFMYWGFWDGATSNLQEGSAMVYNTWKTGTGEWNLTPAGERYEWLFGMGEDATKGGANANPWDTDEMTTVTANGTVEFTGFYGDYEITIDGQTYDLTLNKGEPFYSLVLAPGDYNADGVVNAADYTIWRNTLGSETDLRADGDGNGVVNQLDYLLWRSLYGTEYGSGAGAAAGVPEPSSLALWLLLPLVGLVRRRCGRSRKPA